MGRKYASGRRLSCVSWPLSVPGTRPSGWRRRLGAGAALAAATGAMAKGDFLWWSTGDNETAAWHAVDLRTLD